MLKISSVNTTTCLRAMNKTKPVLVTKVKPVVESKRVEDKNPDENNTYIYETDKQVKDNKNHIDIRI